MRSTIGYISATAGLRVVIFR